jgi:hypothetical protein
LQTLDHVGEFPRRKVDAPLLRFRAFLLPVRPLLLSVQQLATPPPTK